MEDVMWRKRKDSEQVGTTVIIRKRRN